MYAARRRFLASTSGLALAAALPSAQAAAVQSRRLLRLARAELERLGDAIPLRDVVGIADYSRPSREPRFHLVDVASGGVTSLLVAHGRGSDPGHSGRVQRFSNEIGSLASSAGAFRTGECYVGQHGRSMRLAGLEASNSNAESRAIVLHGAWYVNPSVVRADGKLGLSEGCFVFWESDLEGVLERLGPGRLLLSGFYGPS